MKQIDASDFSPEQKASLKKTIDVRIRYFVDSHIVGYTA
jgi:hypothetical protein